MKIALAIIACVALAALAFIIGYTFGVDRINNESRKEKWYDMNTMMIEQFPKPEKSFTETIQELKRKNLDAEIRSDKIISLIMACGVVSEDTARKIKKDVIDKYYMAL